MVKFTLLQHLADGSGKAATSCTPLVTASSSPCSVSAGR
jgi:hypothetical protein